MSTPPNELPDEVLRQQRNLDSEQEQEQDEQSEEDLVSERRGASRQETLDADTGQSEASGVGDRRGAGRQETRDAADDTAPSQEDVGGVPELAPDSEIVERAAGQTQTPESVGQQREAAAREALAEQAVGESDVLTDTSQVDVGGLRETEQGGVTGDIELTESGRQAARQAQQQRTRESIDRLGTTGRVLGREQQQRRQREAQEAFAEDVRTNQFARRQLGEQVESRAGLAPGSVDITVEDGTVRAGQTTGGISRALVREARQQGTDIEDVTVQGTRDGLQLQTTNESIRQSVARRVEGVEADEVEVTDQQQIAPSDVGLFRQADANARVNPQQAGTTARVGELTEAGERDALREQIEERFPNAEFEITTDEQGEAQVEFTERFDDDGRFLGIAGGEAAVEGAAETFSDVTGGAVETSAQFGTGAVFDRIIDVSETTAEGITGDELETTSPGTFQQVSADVGVGAAEVFNVPAVGATLDEAGEFIGVGLTEVEGGRVGTTPTLAISPEFGAESEAAAEFAAAGIEQQVREEPVQFGATLAGSVVGSTGAIRVAGTTTRAGQAARGFLQPGEEALGAVGVRPSGAAAAAASRAARRVGRADVNVVPRFSGRAMAGGGGRRAITISAEDVSARAGTETTTDVEAEVRERLPDPIEFETRAEFEREVQRGVEQELGEGTLESQARQQMPPRSAFESEREFQSELEQRMRQIEEQRMETETQSETDTETELGTQTTTATQVGGTGLEATTRVAFADSGTDAPAITVPEAVTPTETVGDIDSATGTDTRTAVDTVTDTTTDVSTAVTADVTTETDIAQEVEQAIEAETALETEQDLAQELVLESAVETESAIETETETETRRETDRRRDLDLDLDLDSTTLDGPAGSGGEFERVFEANVADPGDVLGLDGDTS